MQNLGWIHSTCHNIVLLWMLTPNSKNILLITISNFFNGVHCTQVNFVYLVNWSKIDNFIKTKHERILIRYPLDPWHHKLSRSMLLLLKFNYLRITVILTLKSMEIDKRSNLEHYVEQAVPLAITTVCLTIIRIISDPPVLLWVCLSDCK